MKTRQDKTRQDKTRQDKTRQDKTSIFYKIHKPCFAFFLLQSRAFLLQFDLNILNNIGV
ncbi:Uncharacterised protein [Brachyspira pilosicoli]|nr:Uncharacterised protein [Brachyspira pilosicoli]